MCLPESSTPRGTSEASDAADDSMHMPASSSSSPSASAMAADEDEDEEEEDAGTTDVGPRPLFRAGAGWAAADSEAAGGGGGGRRARRVRGSTTLSGPGPEVTPPAAAGTQCATL